MSNPIFPGSDPMQPNPARPDPGRSRRPRLRLGFAAWAIAVLLAGAAVGADENAGKIYAYAEFPDLDKPVKGIIAIDPERTTWELIPGTEAASPMARVTPDGRFLAYAVSLTAGPDKVGVWVRPVRGEFEPIRISAAPGVPICWSGDAEQLIIQNAGSPGDPRNPARPPILSQYFRVDADGSHPFALPIPERDYVLDWSSDGQWLLVNTIPRAIGDPGRRVYLLHSDGTGRRMVFEEDRAMPGLHSLASRFTPDGRRITFQQAIQNQGALATASWTVDLDGKERRPIPLEPRDNYFVWSPDGSRLAVSVRDPESDGERGFKRVTRLAIMDADGGNRRSLALPRAKPLLPLDWRPDPSASKDRPPDRPETRRSR